MPAEEVSRHESVLALLTESSPGETAADVMRRKARSIVAKHRGMWKGPPFCPFDLADLEGVFVEPAPCDIRGDGRIFPKGAKVFIQYRPDQTQQRIRFTICHELAHTLFPDCYKRERRRSAAEKAEWEFEELCNIGASEFLFPIEEFVADVGDRLIDGEELRSLASRYDASIDATARRFVNLHPKPACVVFARYTEPVKNAKTILVVQYAVPNHLFGYKIFRNLKINSKAAANVAYLEQRSASAARENWRIGQEWARFRSEAVPLPKFASKETADVAILLYPL